MVYPVRGKQLVVRSPVKSKSTTFNGPFCFHLLNRWRSFPQVRIDDYDLWSVHHIKECKFLKPENKFYRELLLVYLNPCCKFRPPFCYIMLEHLRKDDLESFNKWNIGNIYLIITSILQLIWEKNYSHGYYHLSYYWICTWFMTTLILCSMIHQIIMCFSTNLQEFLAGG